MKIKFCIAALALAFSACGEQAATTVDADADGDGNITDAEARAAVEAAGVDISPMPGKYATALTLIEANIPRASSRELERIEAALTRGSQFCLTPEEAELGFEDMLQEGQGEECNVRAFSIKGNQVNMKLNCAMMGLGEMDVTLDGEVSPTRSDVTTKMSVASPRFGSGDLTLRYKQIRTGDCDS